MVIRLCGALVLCVAALSRVFGSTDYGSSYRGVVTFATPGNGDPFSPTTIQDFDLETGELTVRFDGLDASQAKSGETAYLSRMAPGYDRGGGPPRRAGRATVSLQGLQLLVQRDLRRAEAFAGRESRGIRGAGRWRTGLQEQL
jgi:hypothetical protein